MIEPKLTEFHRKLEQLTGKWSGEETLSEGQKAKSTVTASLGVNQFFLVVDYTQKIGNRVSFRGHGVCGWDPNKQRYTLYWFDSTGHTPNTPAPGVWDGDVLTFHTKNPDGRHSRCVCSVSGKSGTYRIEESTDGVSWRTILEAELKKGRV
jgi:hypothetical protein